MGLFRVCRADGSLQIDDELMTYCFVRKGQVQTQASSDYNFASSVYVPINYGSSEVVAVMISQATRPANSVSALTRYMTTQVGNQWYDVYMSNAPVGSVVTYYVFDQVASQSATGFGLELFDSSGRMTFNSNHAPLVTATPGFSGNFGGDSSRAYAVVLPFAAHQGTTYDHTLQSETTETTDNKGHTTTKTTYWYNATTTNVIRGAATDGYLVSPFDFAMGGNGTSRYAVPNASTPCPADIVVYDIQMQFLLIVDITYL